MKKTTKRLMNGALAMLLVLCMVLPASATDTEIPVTEVPAIETPAPEAPETEAPAVEEPAAEPVKEAPVTEAPVTEVPATEVPAAEEPTAEPTEEVPVTEAPATEEPSAEPVETPAAEEPAAEPTEEAPVTEAPATEAPSAEPAASPAPITEDDLPANAKLMVIIQDELNADRSVSVYAAYDGDFLSFGDSVSLITVLHGYDNVTYSLQWQQSPDNASWSDIPAACGASYSFIINESNYTLFYRVTVTVTGVIVPDDLAAAAQAE